jgi:Ankyrin repeats (3 copies)/Ankyrin repeat
MTRIEPLPFRASLGEYEHQARAVFDALEAGDEAVQWRFKWEHPRFRGKPLTEVQTSRLDLSDAQLLVAREYGFEDWAHLRRFANSIAADGTVTRFETAVEAVISGDVATLRSMVRDDPELVRARSARRHHATLLHYIAANGVEGMRQKTPKNAVDIAKLLLDAGAEVDAHADMYDEKCTTMSMLVSSTPPNEAGLQAALAETLLDYGASLEGRGSKWQSALMTALVFGFPRTAEVLVRGGAAVKDLAAAAGLGRLEDTARLLPDADADSKQVALALAAHLGHTDVVRLLLDAGEDPNRYNPDGFHSHATPLHHAVSSGHLDTVRLLAERGAPLNIQDTMYQGTPLDWAIHLERTEIVDYLRSRGSPGSAVETEGVR